MKACRKDRPPIPECGECFAESNYNQEKLQYIIE